MDRRFLVLEDDAEVARVLTRTLLPYGESIVAGSIGAGRRALAEHREWDAFFVDLSLPDGSGMDVLQDARRAHPGTRAMILTGLASQESINRAFDLKATLVTKPIATQRIISFVQ